MKRLASWLFVNLPRGGGSKLGPWLFRLAIGPRKIRLCMTTDWRRR